MTNTNIVDATVWPQDDGTGVPDGSESYDSAGSFSLLSRYKGDGNYVGEDTSGDATLQFNDVDTSNNEFDVGTGHAYISDSVSIQSGAQTTYDTTLPDDVPYVVVLPNEVTNLSLDSGTNDVWLAVDPTSNDDVYIRHGSGLSAPSDPSVKLGTIDASSGDTTRAKDNADTTFSSVTTEKAVLNKKPRTTWGVPTTPTGEIEASSKYENEPRIIVSEGVPIVFYREAGGHIDNNGKIVCRRYADGSWGSETVVADHPNNDTRNHVVITGDGTISVLAQIYADGGGGWADIIRTESSDNGKTWTALSSIAGEFNMAEPVPFGPVVDTSAGKLVSLYQSGLVKSAITTDNGQSFGTETTIKDTTGNGSRSAVEPVVVNTFDDNLICLCRENEQDEVYIATSADGGSSWADASEPYVQLNGSFDAGDKIFWAQQHGGTLLFAVADRARNELLTFALPARYAWQNPTFVKSVRPSIVTPFDATGQDVGYPSFYSNDGEMFLTWYDDRNVAGEPDIWQASLSLPDEWPFNVGTLVDESSNRSGATWYQNSTGQPLKVHVMVEDVNGGRVRARLSVETTKTINVVDENTDAGNGSDFSTASASAIVPNGEFYRADVTGPTLKWREQVLGFN